MLVRNEIPWGVVTEVEMHLWCMAVTQVFAAGPALNRLGRFTEDGIRYGSGGSGRMLVVYSEKRVKLSRL